MSDAPARKTSDLMVECLEAEGIEYVFGVPGEENLDLLDSLSRSHNPGVRVAMAHLFPLPASFAGNHHLQLTRDAGWSLGFKGTGTGMASAQAQA